MNQTEYVCQANSERHNKSRYVVNLIRERRRVNIVRDL